MAFTPFPPGDRSGAIPGDLGLEAAASFDSGVIGASDFEIITSIIVLPLQFAAAADIRTSLGSHMRVLLVSLIMNRSLPRIHSSSTSNTSRPSPLIHRNKIDENNEAGMKQ